MNTSTRPLKSVHRVLYYIVLFGLFFQFFAFPAYAMAAYFPYGADSKYHIPFIRPNERITYSDPYESNRSANKENTPKQHTADKQPHFVKESSVASEMILEMYSAEESGIIGYNNESNSDDPADNLFTIEVNKQELQGRTLQLSYEVYGIENTSGIARSINEHTATGGFFVQKSKEWKEVQETVSVHQLKQGLNHILFTTFENQKLDYKIRNVKLTAFPNATNRLVSLADGNDLYVKDGKAYVKGTVLAGNTQLYINGNYVPVRNNEFEAVLEASSELKNLDIRLVHSGSVIYHEDVSIESIREVSDAVAYKAPEMMIPVRQDKDGSYGFALADVDLNITKENYENADRITVQKLRDIDVAPVGTNIINVTAGTSAYRFLPDGATFNEPAKLTLRYDQNRLPKGYDARDVKVLYFDMDQRRWLAVPTDTIMADEHKIVALTDHFTDYIAGVIQAPESPETNAFTPTSISDIQVANPTANIVQIQPPTANQQGDGTVDFPITVPPARAGLQPNLSVSYNNNGSSGIAGYGWDIAIPHISVDTRFGVPTYNQNYETESYLLNGEELLLAPNPTGSNYLPHRSSTQKARVTDAVFIPKVESSFSKIVRKGTDPTNYYWEVWDKSGTKYTYGGPSNFDITYAYFNEPTGEHSSSILKSHPTATNAKRAKWFLSEVRDKNNNIIRYNYKMKNAPSSGVFKDGMEVYLSNIVYNRNTDFSTSNPSQDRNYTVSFLYKNTTRADAQTNYRYGFKENSSMLLDKINVSCAKFGDGLPGGVPVSGSGYSMLPCDNEIEYQFTYNTQGAFAKTLLTKITTKNIRINMSTGLPAETQQYDHEFQYYNDIAGGLFKSPESIFVDKDFSDDKHALLSSTVEDFTSSHFGFSAGVSTASNPPVWWPFSNSGTINLSFPSATSTSSGPTMLLMDIDGDGLDDKVMKIGNQIKYRKNLAGIAFSKQLYTAYNISDLGFSQNDTKTDPELSFSLLFLNLTSSKSQSNARSRIYFTDVNNDGLVDYVKDKIVYFNRMDPNSGMPAFTDNSDLTPNVILRGGQVDPSVSQGLPDFDIDNGLMDVVKVWVAPKNGNVNITGSITKPFVASNNGVRFSVEHGKSTSTFSTYLINPTLLVNATHQTNVSNTNVNKGDHIYFRVNSSQFPDDEVTVNWNPAVVYTNGSDGSNFNDSFLFGDIEAEPAIIKESGQYRVEWTPSSVNLPGGIQLTVKAYTLNPNNLSAPKTNIFSHTQTVTTWLDYQSSLFNINAGSVSSSNPDTYIYVEIEATGNSTQNWKQFDNAFVPVLKKISDNSFVHIVPKYNISNNLLKDLGIGTVYKNWGQFAYKGALPDEDFTPIKKEYISKSQLTGAQPHPLMNIQPSSVSYNFTTGTFSSGGSNFTVPAGQKAAMEHFTMLRPDRANLAWSAHPGLLVKGLAMNPNYRTDNSSYTPMVPIAAPTGVGTYGAYGIVKESTTVSQSSNWSTSFYGFGLGNGANKATSQPINDYIDINGDGYPDIVGDKIQFTSNKGGLTTTFLNKSLMAASVSNGSGKTAGGASAHVTQIADTRGRFSRIRVGNSSSFTPNISGGASKFETVTSADHILLDLNGDGLPDIVKSQGQVEFNTASSFVAGTWAGYDKPSVSKTTSVSFSGNLGGTFSDFTGTFPNNFVGNFLAQSNLDLAFGVNNSRSSTQREKDFVDINGDGLPDFISGNSVKINNGTGFSSVSYNLDRMSESTSFSIGTTLNASVLIPVPLSALVIKAGGGGGASFGKSYNEDNVSLRDFNGDGYPDIVETVSEYEIKVRYSKIGRTNMLKKIINPTGSTIELDYDTQNKISETSIGSTYKMPFKKWVLTNVKIYDGFAGDGEDLQEYAFEYHNGLKDRRERKFLGFGEVKTHQLNRSGKVYRTVVEQYLLNEMPNQHIYLKGSHSDSRKYHYIAKLPARTATFDGQNKMLNEVVYFYSIFQRPVLIAGDGLYNTTVPPANFTYTDISSIVPLLQSMTNTTYHYNISGSSVLPNEIISRFKEYDRYGNVTKFEEQVNGVVTNNVQIGYHYLTGTQYNVATPASHNLNNYQRYSTTTLDAKGNVKQINRHKGYGSSGSQVSTTDYLFDLFGNISKVTLPKPAASSSNAQRMFFNFTYDNLFHKNLIKIVDAQGYQSETTYNHFGLVTKQKDMNKVEIINKYDPTLRLIEVKGPYNSQWTIKHEYKKNATTGRYYAVTKHNIKDETAGSGEQVLHTSSFADGLGRIIQTKKELDLAQECGAASTGYRFAVSGIQIYDEFGRVVESDLSQEQINCNGNFLSTLESYTPLTRNPLLKTTMIYDMQDRMLQSHIHGLNASTVYEYGYGADHNNIQRYYEKVTLPEGNISQTFKDAKGQVVLTKQIDDINNITLLTKYNYNTIGELLQVTDANNKTTAYQYDTFGQKTEVLHPDSGISKFEYDLTGKLVATTNQNLLNQNSSARIQYQYVFNQLQSVTYPGITSNGVAIPSSTVNYTYGGNNAPNYSTGRVTSVTDLTGTRSFEYGKLGEVVKENRTLEGAVGTMQFVTQYQYDTWGRMLNLTYPDGEVVTYHYNKAGQLKSITSNDAGYYLKNVTYNFFDQPVRIEYGNDVVTLNTYDLTQRIRGMRLDRPDTTTFMHNLYNYDKNQNIVNIHNGSSQHPLLKMGGISTKNYTYDRFNRLASANGSWSGGNNESHSYTLNMTYNNTHGIVNKNQHHNVQSPTFNGLTDNTYNAQYQYNDTAHPHAVSRITYNGLSGNQSAVSNFTYDANGNLINYNTNQGGFANRNMIWDQQNRLLAVVDDNTSVSHYIYDHAGERTFKSNGAITQINIAGAAIHEVLDFNKYLIYPSGYLVADPGKNEYSKHYYINGKRFVSRLGWNISQFAAAPPPGAYSAYGTGSTQTDGLDMNALAGTQYTTFGIGVGNTEADCLAQVNNIIAAYESMNSSMGGAILHCVNALKAIRTKIGTTVNGQPFTACDALIEINAYVCTPQNTNTPGSTPTPGFTAEELLQFDCLTELNILIAQYIVAADKTGQLRMMPFGGFKYGCNGPYDDHNCCWRYKHTGVWDCPECPELTPTDCGIVPVGDQTEEWKDCIRDCLYTSTNPGYGTHCWNMFLQTGQWMDDCFMLLVDCDHCSDLVGTTTPGQQEINCLRNCTVPGMGACLEYFDAFGVWTKECQNLSIQCGCREEGGGGEGEMSDCAQDCPNPQATPCYEHYLQHGFWQPGCEDVMRDCGCYDPNNELDCYKKALNYIRQNLTFEPNNACEVLAYVQANFNCIKQEIVRPDKPVPFPDLNLPTPHPDSNNNLPGQDGPYPEAQRKPIWWYHSDHLGSSTYLTDNFGRPSHYYETLPFGEMIVEHNQSAVNPTNNGYDNKYKFNGKELDDVTGMYYYGARYYDPRISIFVSVDPLAELTMTPYQYVHNNPIMFTDPTGMSAEGGDGGGWWSKITNGVKSLFSSSNQPETSPIEHTELDEVVVSSNRKPNWFQRSFSKDKLANDWKNIKERSGANHLAKWISGRNTSGGYHFYDSSKPGGSGDQSLGKKWTPKNKDEKLISVESSAAYQAASFAKVGEGIGNIKSGKASLNIFNNVYSGTNLGSSIPDAKVQVPTSINYTVDGFYNGLSKVIYQTITGEYKDTIVPISEARGAAQALYKRDQQRNQRRNE